MRVAILGVGGVGRTLIQQLRSEPVIDSLVLIDKVADRTRFFAGMSGRVHIEARPYDSDSATNLAGVIRGCDVVANTLPPRYNLAVMRACREAGTHYLDLAASGPREPGGVTGILEQLQMHESFRSAGLRALVSMGLDPGMSNVMVREAVDGLDSVDRIRIRSGGTVTIPGFLASAFPLYSRETFLSDILLRPTVWFDGKLEERAPLGDPEDFSFPAPVGTQRTYLVSHEEVKTLPKYLPKPVRHVDFKQAYDPSLLGAVLSLNRLGLLDANRKVRVGTEVVPFRRVLLEALPEPSALVHPLGGTKALSIEVEGVAGGKRSGCRRDILMDHREANRRAGITAVIYLTAVAAAIGILLLGEGAVPGAGVYPPEALDPDRVLREWTARDLPILKSEQLLPA